MANTKNENVEAKLGQSGPKPESNNVGQSGPNQGGVKYVTYTLDDVENMSRILNDINFKGSDCFKVATLMDILNRRGTPSTGSAS